MPPRMTTCSASCSVSLLARFGTKPMAPRSMARITSALRSDAETTTTGTRRIGVAQLGQHLEAVGVAEAQVEQHEIEVRIGGERLARGARAGHADHGDVAADALDDVLQRREDQWVVVDQQDFHRDLDLHV